jgi:hypothetical protein
MWHAGMQANVCSKPNYLPTAMFGEGMVEYPKLYSQTSQLFKTSFAHLFLSLGYQLKHLTRRQCTYVDMSRNNAIMHVIAYI